MTRTELESEHQKLLNLYKYSYLFIHMLIAKNGGDNLTINYSELENTRMDVRPLIFNKDEQTKTITVRLKNDN